MSEKRTPATVRKTRPKWGSAVPRPPRPLEPARSVQDYAGAQLRAWRIRRGLSQQQLGEMVHVSGALIGKLEKAERLCAPKIATALDATLGAGGALASVWHHAAAEQHRQRAESDGNRTTPLGPVQRPDASETMAVHENDASEESTEPVDRRNFLRTLPAVHISGAAVGLLEQIQTSALPRSVSAADIAHIHSIAHFFNAWDYSHGGTTIRETVSAEMGHAMRLLSVPCSERLRPGLFAAVGYLGVVGGAVLFDGHEHDLASRVFAFAAECSEEAGDWHLRAKAHSWHARQEIWRGDADAGLTYAQLGLVRSDRLTATERAMLHTATARALARLGRAEDALRSIGHADDNFAGSAPAEDPPWMAYYDRAQHLGDTGHALFDIAVHGKQVSEATGRLDDAVTGHSDEYVRSRAFSGLKLAELAMRTGDPHQAVTIALNALRDAAVVHSRRLDRATAELAQASARHRNIPEVEDLTNTIKKDTGNP
jgi:ribosome-binding protein aMBF1 (putative translation factor)